MKEIDLRVQVLNSFYIEIETIFSDNIIKLAFSRNIHDNIFDSIASIDYYI